MTTANLASILSRFARWNIAWCLVPLWTIRSIEESGANRPVRWATLPKRFTHVKLDEYIFMPNHMHGIIELTDLDVNHPGPRAPLWEIIRVFKAATTYQIRRSEGQPWFAWQDEFYDLVIRTEDALHQKRHYILENPTRWSQDKWYKRY